MSESKAEPSWKHPIVKFATALTHIISDEQSRVLGKVLTVIDATFTDTEQCKAVKDLIKQAVWSHSEAHRRITHLIQKYTVFIGTPKVLAGMTDDVMKDIGYNKNNPHLFSEEFTN